LRKARGRPWGNCTLPHAGNADGKHYWLTPPALLAALQEEFGFDFDACPYPLPKGFDGLSVEWGASTYVNPPFKGPTAWVRKALAEQKNGRRVAFVFPISKWIHMLLAAGATVRNLGDVRWCATEDGAPGKGIGQHIALFILEPGALTTRGHGAHTGSQGRITTMTTKTRTLAAPPTIDAFLTQATALAASCAALLAVKGPASKILPVGIRAIMRTVERIVTWATNNQAAYNALREAAQATTPAGKAQRAGA
jgi:hypothetical protein